MGNRVYDNVVSLGRGTTLLTGYVTTSAGGGVTGNAERGAGVTIAKTATGEYTLTLADKYSGFRFVNASVARNTTSDFLVRPKSFSSSSKQVVLQVLAGTTKTNLTAGNLMYMIVARNSTVKK